MPANILVYQNHQWTEDEFRRYVGDPVAYRKSGNIIPWSQDRGILYMLSHESNRLVKVGATAKNADVRLRDYTKHHRLSGKWSIYYEWSVADVYKVESAVSIALRLFRVSKRSREVYACTPDEALVEIHKAIRQFGS